MMEELSAKLEILLKSCAGNSTHLHSCIVAIMKDALKTQWKIAEQNLKQDGQGTCCAQFLANSIDEIIQSLFYFISEKIYQKPKEPLAMVAIGGYGRKGLAPGSDIDLLFLIANEQTQLSKKIIEFILYILWDIGLKIGYATRNISDCLSLIQSDHVSLTALLDARFLCGDETLFQEMVRQFHSCLKHVDPSHFIKDKLSERNRRHARAGESRYLVEPDIKNSKGGQRDLHTLFWIAKYLTSTSESGAFRIETIFTKSEIARFKKCENFLNVVRCHLHFLTGRAENHLRFDYQSEIAEILHYQKRGALRAVERFMKHYFLIAKEVGDLTRIFCAVLEDDILQTSASHKRSDCVLHQQLCLKRDRLCFKEPDRLVEQPLNMMRFFAAIGKYNLAPQAQALTEIRRSLPMIRTDFRNSNEANQLFLEILCSSQDPVKTLHLMNETGVLGYFIPDFGQIVAMTQFNMYHHYTVDEHLIRTVGIVHDIERGHWSELHPLSTEIFPTLTSRRALYVAALMHDIAKGREQDHSIAGAQIAVGLAPRLTLNGQETETLIWLIRHHLLMSETAQMRDLHDPKTINDFAVIVQSLERLKLLLVLTVADIRAVGPAVWSGWKGELLRTLYWETELVLSGGRVGITHTSRIAQAQAEFFDNFPSMNPLEREEIAHLHEDAYWLNVPIDKKRIHHTLRQKEQTQEATIHSITHHVRFDAFTDVTELTIYSADHPRFLMIIFGACVMANANIISAQIFTTKDGMALDSVLIQRSFKALEDEKRRADFIANTINKILDGRLHLKNIIQAADLPQARLQAFCVQPRVIIDNNSSNRFTIIEINGLDRIGLLYDVTSTLFLLNLNIASAHITTFGEKAVDVFYVTDLDGKKIEAGAHYLLIEKTLLETLEGHALR